jgi:HSP20 family protein
MKKRNDFIWDTGWTMNLFNRMVREVSGKFPTVPESAGETSEPAMDIFEDDSDVIIDLEVPGLNREDLRVRIDEDFICIEGYKRGGRDVTCLTYLCLERQYGAFRRIVKIPCSVDTTSVRAFLRDGILRIMLKRISDRRKSAVEVRIGD